MNDPEELNQDTCLAIKGQMLNRLSEILQERLETANHAISETRLSLQGETKSSAGDKYETGRAMMQQELGKHEASRHSIMQQLQSLDHLKAKTTQKTIEQGTLVVSDVATFYLSFSFGSLHLAGNTVFVVSAMSPIGQLLVGKMRGDQFAFQGKLTKILFIC